jgi:vitamin B12 transporter
MSSLSPGLVCAIVVLAGNAAAENEPVAQSEVVVVTANRLAVHLRETLQHTTVITGEEIRQAQPPDLPTLLQQRAGVEFTQNGGPGKLATSFLRGTESDHTLVLIDGVRVNSATSGFTAIEQIMPEQVERIEIVRGNVSSLYGSEAIGGVIQIFTKEGRGPPAFALSGGLGSERTARLAASYAGATERTRFSVALSGLRTDGFSAVDSAFVPIEFVTLAQDVDRDGYRNGSVSAKLSHEFVPGHSLGAMAFHSEGKVDFDGAFQNRSKPKLSALSLYSHNRFTANWLAKFTLAQGVDDLESFLDDARVSRFKTTSDQFNWQNEVSLSEAHRLSLGAEYLRQKVSSDTAFTNTARNVTSLYATYFGDLGPHTLQANLRYDEFSDFGGKATGLLGYGFDFTQHWRATASVSTAFKAPTFNELYDPFFGNKDLRPERAKSAEAGVQWSDERQLFKMAYFANRVDDLITIVQFTPTTFKSDNVDRARIGGVEASYQGAAGDYDWRASFTWQDPKDRRRDTRLLRRARTFASASLARAFGAWRVGGELLASGDRIDIPIDAVTGDERVRLPGYAVVNLFSSYRVSEHTSIGLRLANVFDKHYQTVHGYVSQPRAWFLSASHEFR